MDYRVDFESLEWEEAMPGVRHKIIDRTGSRLRLVEYFNSMEPHWCDRGHIGMILEGEFEIEYDSCTEMYGPGDGVFIPSGDEHRHKAVVLTEKVRAVFVEEG